MCVGMYRYTYIYIIYKHIYEFIWIYICVCVCSWQIWNEAVGAPMQKCIKIYLVITSSLLIFQKYKKNYWIPISINSNLILDSKGKYLSSPNERVINKSNTANLLNFFFLYTIPPCQPSCMYLVSAPCKHAR